MRNIIAALLALALFITLLTAWAFPRINEDLFLGLCLGREVANGTFTDPNSWSFVLPAQVFVDRAWLSHFVFYLSYNLLGCLGPLFIKAILLSCCTVILYFRCRALDVSRETAFLAITLGMFALAPFLAIRAETFGLLCFLSLTTLLSAPPSWGRYRELGAVLVVVLWSNIHGSWPLGALFIGIRFCLDLLYAFNILNPRFKREVLNEAQNPNVQVPTTLWNRIGRSDSVTGADPFGWFAAGFALFPLILVLNPYGWRSFLVFDYIRSMDKFERVARWQDNLSLFDFHNIFSYPFYNGLSVVPFILILILLPLLALTAFVLHRQKGRAPRPFLSPTTGDKWMEIAVAFVLISLIFKWGRLITFGAPALVPLLALLLQANIEPLYEYLKLSRTRAGLILRTWGPVLTAVALLAAVFSLFSTSVIRSYLPQNPMGFLRVAPPLQERLMNYDLAWKDVVEFMRRNHITGKVMTSLQLSDYLLWNLPNIRVLLDLRAHAAYTPDNFAAYFTVVRAVTGRADPAIDVLDRLGVDFVVLDSVVQNHVPAALALMGTRKWACIYKDRWVYVLARPDSELLKSRETTDKLESLWYQNPETLYVSEAFLSQFMTGSIPDKLLDNLKASVSQFPDPEVYVLIALAMGANKGCLPENARKYLREEALRLSRTNYMVSGGVRDILDSARRIFSLLASDAAKCGPKLLGEKYREYADYMATLFKELCRKYSVVVECW